MTFTRDEIEQDWLLDGRIALPLDEVTRAFNTVVARFGRDWVEASRVHSGVVSRGTTDVLYVVTLGQMLDALGDASNIEGLFEKVRNNNSDAWAELSAAYLVSKNDTEIEIEPSVTVGGRNRKPDFRVRRDQAAWTYVEVTQPSRSDAQVGVLRDLERLTNLVQYCTGTFALEVFLKRDPSAAEVSLIASRIVEGHTDTTTRRTDLDSGLGALYWNTHPAGVVVVDDHGETYTPRLGRSAVALRETEHRHITARWPFTDRRAQAFLESEAKQLPKDSPGLIMIQTSNAVGAMKAWRALIEPRFQRNLHTRVGAVCLFTSGQWHSDAGEEWRAEAKLVPNPYARHPLPDWLIHKLERFASYEPDIG